MVKQGFVALAIALAAVASVAQEPEFAATAPAKVLLPMESGAATPPPESPAPESVAEEPTGEVDEIVAAIGADMDEQEAAARRGTATEEAAPAQSSDSSTAKSLGRGIVALFLTLALLLLIFAAVKRWGRRTPLLAGQQLARVIGRVGLSPQASLHFVQTNGEVLVIGVTQQSVSLLRTFEASDFEAPAGAAERVSAGNPTNGDLAGERAASFLAQLKESRAAMGVEAGMDEDLDQLKGELQRLKQYFQDSTRARE